MKYNKQHAKECVRSDWFDLMPRYNDRQFEQAFQLIRAMVESIVLKLAAHDPILDLKTRLLW